MTTGYKTEGYKEVSHEWVDDETLIVNFEHDDLPLVKTITLKAVAVEEE